MRALERLIAILEAVADHSSDATTTSISTRVGLSLSTTARLVRELEQEGLIERTYENGPYTLGRRFLALARSAIQPASLINAALPVMEELRDLTHETVSLHVRQRALRVCIAQVESRRQVRRVVPVGFEVGINVGATGEVLLAGFPAPDLASYVDSLGLATPDRAALEVRLEQIRRDKWALTVDQVEDGLSGIAAAVIAGGQTIAALSISGPSARWTVSVMRGSFRTSWMARDASRFGWPGTRVDPSTRSPGSPESLITAQRLVERSLASFAPKLAVIDAPAASHLCRTRGAHRQARRGVDERGRRPRSAGRDVAPQRTRVHRVRRGLHARRHTARRRG